MASSMTPWTKETGRSNKNRSNKILPQFDHTRRSSLRRLSTFSTMPVDDARRISAVRLAGSGCVLNPENVYFDCIGCGKITMLADAPTIITLNDIKVCHSLTCYCAMVYIKKQDERISERDINLNELETPPPQRSQQDDVRGYEEVINEYGILQR
ncbi:uncharacterized protein [Magallana gigas]|uniref:uncharacterized protein n=1 Tax=Magallana gigas TaxID=29159 RepID=UPI00333F1D39